MSTVFTDKDVYYMRQALELAKNGEGRVSPNPPVGCVLVRGGGIVGRGWHDRLGDLHAEAMALRDAGQRAKRATAYVTLSPCATHGRQPPCADALIRAGVGQVIAAAVDPNGKNANGLDVVRAAGIPARDGLLREEAEYLARGFFKSMRRGLPFVTLKYAMTLDGKIATASGDSRWVSGPASRELVHDMRSRHDAILVGIGTVLSDDPQLNVREPAYGRRGGAEKHPQPRRIIADSRCRLSPDAALFHADPPGGHIIVATGENADPERRRALEAAGAEVLPVPLIDNRLSLSALLECMAAKGIAMVLCESGGELAAGMLKAKLVDEITAFIAPKLAGGIRAPGPVADLGIDKMADAVRLAPRECLSVGDDILIRAGVEAG